MESGRQWWWCSVTVPGRVVVQPDVLQLQQEMLGDTGGAGGRYLQPPAGLTQHRATSLLSAAQTWRENVKQSPFLPQLQLMEVWICCGLATATQVGIPLTMSLIKYPYPLYFNLY